MNPRLNQNNYRIINLTFAGIILAVILYSFIYGADGRKHPVPSGPQWLTGESSPSTGLSRSFSEIVRFRFAEARQFNPHGIRIFSFFAVQLLLRIIVSVLLFRQDPKRLQILVLADAIGSALLFAGCFWPFIFNLARQLETLLR